MTPHKNPIGGLSIYVVGKWSTPVSLVPALPLALALALVLVAALALAVVLVVVLPLTLTELLMVSRH